MSTGYYLLDNPPARSQFRRTRRAKPTGCIVVHTTESILDKIGTDSGAENVARFIQRRGNPGNYHRIGDRDSIVRMVPFSYEVWQDGTGSNRWAIGISLAMQAHTWPDLTTQHRNQLLTTLVKMAREAADWLKSEHGITVPAVRLTKAESDAGKPGFIAHADRDPARRSDPGKHFPWTQFLNLYQNSQEDQLPTDFIAKIKAASEHAEYTPTDDLDQLAENMTDISAGLMKSLAREADLKKLVEQYQADRDFANAVRALVQAEQQ